MKIEEVKRLGLNIKNVDLNSLDNLSSFFEEGFNFIDLSNIDSSLKNDYINKLLGNHHREDLFISDTISNNISEEETFFNSKLNKIKYYDCVFISNTRDMEPEDGRYLNDFLVNQKNKNNIHYVGLLYDSNNQFLNNILLDYSIIDFVGLNVNYLDWINDHNFIRQNIELCKKLNKKIIAFNFDKDKNLSDKFPSDLEDILRENDPYSSPRSWAIRFVNSLENISIIVSNPITKKELYDDIISINYKSDKMTSSEINCLNEICKKIYL